MPQLTLHPGTPAAFTFRWTEGGCTIGRAVGNHVIIDLEPISTYQAKIERRGDDYWLIDLNSTNGTVLGPGRVQESRLQDGDRGSFAEVAPFGFELLPAERSAALPAEPVAAFPVSPAASLDPVERGVSLQAGQPCPACQAFVPAGAQFCPRCGCNLGRALMSAYPASPAVIDTPYLRPMEPVGGGVGVLPLLALLCGLSIIGFPFASCSGSWRSTRSANTAGLPPTGVRRWQGSRSGSSGWWWRPACSAGTASAGFSGTGNEF
ncbi:FHA domain-containing protein [bacterium]|nr:FHA domain-containing protein [bacterium]